MVSSVNILLSSYGSYCWVTLCDNNTYDNDFDMECSYSDTYGIRQTIWFHWACAFCLINYILQK